MRYITRKMRLERKERCFYRSIKDFEIREVFFFLDSIFKEIKKKC